MWSNFYIWHKSWNLYTGYLLLICSSPQKTNTILQPQINATIQTKMNNERSWIFNWQWIWQKLPFLKQDSHILIVQYVSSTSYTGPWLSIQVHLVNDYFQKYKQNNQISEQYIIPHIMSCKMDHFDIPLWSEQHTASPENSYL